MIKRDNTFSNFFLDDFFDFDKKFYNFKREEKDMTPYDIIKKDGKLIMTHNVLGIAKEDLKVSKKIENGTPYISISGSTKDEITGKTYSVNSRFSYNPTEIDISKATSELKNGLIYITIPYKTEKEKVLEEEIEIR